MNKLNIDDIVKVKHPGMADDEKEGSVTGMQKWPDGTIVYDLKVHYDCPDGGEGWDGTAQVKDGEYEVVGHGGNSEPKSLGEYSMTLKLEGTEDIKSQLKEIESSIDKIIEKKKQIGA